MRSAVFLLSLVAAVSATVFITNPTAASLFTAGQNASITWQDDGKAPSLALFGPSRFSIDVGNQISQTEVQLIAANVNVSSTSTVVFVPQPTVGVSGKYYFIRVQSLNAKDPNNPAFPALAFSATFAINGATGQFSPAEQAQISGSSAPSSSSGSLRLSTAAPSSTSKTVSSSASAPHSSTSNAVVGVSVAKFATGLLIGVVGWAML